MDFDQIVRNILFENEATGAETTEDQQEKLHRDGLAAYVTSKFSELQTIFTNHYGSSNKFIVNSEIIPLVNNVTYGAGKTRSGGYDKDKIEEIFPLYDFIAYLYESYFKGKKNPGDTELDKAFENFTKTLENSSKIPLEFPAMSSWGKNVKENYTQLSKQEVGKIKLEALPTYLTFWGAIKSLLESYEKAKFSILPRSLKGLKPLNSIEKIFADPNIAATGKFVFNDEKMNSIYDMLAKTTITNVAIAAYRLYTHQIKSNFTDENQIKSLLLNKDKFQEFMGISFPVEKAPEMSWKNSVIESVFLSNVYSQSISFDEMFEMLNKHLLKESRPATPEQLQAASRRASQPEIQALARQTPTAELAGATTKETPTAEETPAAVEIPAAPVSQFAVKDKPDMFLYNLENLKKPSQIPEVTTFIKALQDLANKLKQKSGLNWAERGDSLVDLANSLNLGVKTGF